jgi:DNA invertase Pin-like site-specific DNA recombinase
MFVRAYLRASTDDQNANRARDQLKAFVAQRGLSVAAWYVENVSGAKLSRPELFRLLNDAQPGDILLVEQVDRLSRLTTGDWEQLKAELTARRVRVVALDLPTSWMMATNNADEFTGRMFEAINGMLLDMLAAVARKDYDDRGRRQAQGQAKAKVEGRYKGPPRGYGAQCWHRQPARGGPLLELHSGHDGLQPRHGREGGKTGCRCMTDRVRIIKQEAVPDCGSFEIRFPDGRSSQYFLLG